MHHKLLHFHTHIFGWHYLWYEQLVAVLLAVFLFVMPASAAMRFQDRGLYMQSSEPGVTTSYTVSFRYMSPEPVGSVDMLFCYDPIPHHECIAPAGLDVSGATLVDQQGETGYSILSKSPNHILLTRTAAAPINPASSYTFNAIVNPTDTTKSFAVRLKSHASNNATGPQIDFGSIKGQATTSIVIETQVPPVLIFCLAQEVAEECGDTNGVYFTDMGDLSPTSTLTAQSQMGVGTNATGGFAITANGDPPSAGTNSIAPLTEPTESIPGQNQFGINLVENTAPAVGKNPEGDWANALPSLDYATPDKYKYVSGDLIAYSPNVSLMKIFTVSYIVNASETLRAGVYSTTITYIASGRF